MKTLPKSHTEFCRMLYDCIDLSEFPEGSTLKSIMINELDTKNLTINLVERWLQGLPTACTIPFTDYEIRQILDSCGNGNWSIDQYWRFCASRVLSFATSRNFP